MTAQTPQKEYIITEVFRDYLIAVLLDNDEDDVAKMLEGCVSHSSSDAKVLDSVLVTEIIGTLTITEGFVPTAIRSEVMRLRERLTKELRQGKQP